MKSTQKKYLSMTYLQQVFPVSLFPLQENARVFKTEQGELFSGKSVELLEIKDLNTYSLRMLRDCFHIAKEEHSPLFSFRWMNLGMMSNGKCLTLSIGYPKTEKESLFSVLEEKIDKKYYLSKAMVKYVLKHQEVAKMASTQIANTIQTKQGQMDSNYIIEYLGIDSGETRIRRLTPLECERLQGFPDNWTEGVSDTQRYKQMGNAVSVPVIETLGKKLLKIVKKTNTLSPDYGQS